MNVSHVNINFAYVIVYRSISEEGDYNLLGGVFVFIDVPSSKLLNYKIVGHYNYCVSDNTT